MAIGHYLKEIGRGKDGARDLTREQAADLMARILDGDVNDLEIGAFCVAMRIKGETPLEMAGFLDSTHRRIARLPASPHALLPTVVIPSYNGARKLPVLTALLALMLAREGFSVLVHGTPTEDRRVFSGEVFQQLGVHPQVQLSAIAPGTVGFIPTALLCPGLQRLLNVRRVLQLRNPAHSLVKLMIPCEEPAIVVSSYTHPEYAQSMGQTLQILESNCMLLRGTEGESVADPRRTPKMELFAGGQLRHTLAAQTGSLVSVPSLPDAIDAATTAAYIQSVVSGSTPLPMPIAQQIAGIRQLAETL